MGLEYIIVINFFYMLNVLFVLKWSMGCIYMSILSPNKYRNKFRLELYADGQPIRLDPLE